MLGFNRFRGHILLFLALSVFGLSAYAGTPTFSIAFSPTTIAPGATSTLTYTIDNSANNVGITSVSFSNTLPAGMTIQNPSQATLNCDASGTFSAVAGANSVTFSDYRIGLGATCTLSVDVTSSTGGSHVNTTGALTSSEGSSGTANATLTVDTSRPGFSGTFVPSTIGPGGLSRLTYTVDNSLNGANALLLTVSDTLPNGVVVADDPSPSSTCNQTFTPIFTVTPGGSSFVMQAGGVAAGSTCTIAYNVTAAATGTYAHESGQLSQNGSNPSGSATASLSVVTSFLNLQLPNVVSPGQSVSLTFTLQNTDRNNSATNISFTNDLNATLSGLAATALPATGFCGAGSTISGTSNITVSNASLAPEASCTFSITVLVPSNAAEGQYTNNTSTVNLVLDSVTTKPAASAVLNVKKGPSLQLQFLSSAVTGGSDVTARFTITNTDSVNTITAVGFTMSVNGPAAGTVIKTLPSANSCGAGSSFSQQDSSGALSLVVTNANLAAGANCTFDFVLTLPSSGTTGNVNFETSYVSSTKSGSVVYGLPASSSVTVVSGPTLTLDIVEGAIAPGGTVTANLTLAYSANAAADVTGVGFTVDLNAALAGLASTSGTQSNVCGTGSSFSGTSTLTLTGASLSPGGTCTFSVVLQVPANAVPSTITVTSSSVAGTTSALAVTSPAGSDTLTITGLSLTKTFIPNPALPGTSATLRYTLSNSASALAATAIQFSDSLTSVISTMQATSLPATPCGGSSNMAGTTTVVFSGGELQPGASCTIDVPIAIPSNAQPGSYLSTSSAVGATVNASNTSTPAASATLTIETLTVTISSSLTSPTETSPIPVAINFSRDVVNFAVSDLSITNGNASNFSGSGNSYTVDITPAAAGAVTVSLPANLVDDAVDGTVKNPASSVFSIDYALPPVVMAVTVPGSAVNNLGKNYVISGTHTFEGTTVYLFADSNNDGVADNSTALATSTVVDNKWSLNATLAFQVANNFVAAWDDRQAKITRYVDVPTITETTPNYDPVISGTPATTVNEDSNYSFTPTASDANENHTISFSITNKPSWANFSTVTGELSGTPDNSNVGTTSNIVITVTDSTSASANLPAFSLTVNNVNDAPVITGTPATSVNEDAAYSFTPTVNDVDVGDTKTFSIVNKPAWASFSTTTGALTGTPTNDDVGVYNGIVITVADGASATDSLASFNLTVVNTNDAPVDIALSNASVSHSAGVNAVVGTLTTTDVDVGDSFTYSLVAGAGDTHNSLFNINGDKLRANDPLNTAAGTYNIRVQTNDGTANFAKTFSITVADDVQATVNSVSVPPNATYKFGENLDFVVTYSEVVNVTTTNGVPRIALMVGSTTQYASYVSGSGTAALTFRYVVDTGHFDNDGISATNSIDFNGGQMLDGGLSSVSTNLNALPSLAAVLVDGIVPVLAIVTPVPSPTKEVTPSVVISSDADGVLNVSGGCGTSSATNISSGNITLTLTQADNSTGLVEGTYNACKVTVTGTNGNTSAPLTLNEFIVDLTAPTLNNNDALAVNEGESATVTSSLLSFSDSVTTDNAGISYTLASLPANGQLKLNTVALASGESFSQAQINQGLVTYLHDGSETLSDTFMFSVQDAAGNTALDGANNFTFSINVAPQNDAPVISGTPQTSVLEDVAYSFTPTASDPDVGQTLTFAVQNLPAWASFNSATGNLIGVPTNDHVGLSGTIVISVSDGTTSTALPGFTINVVNINDAPVISGIPQTSVQEDAAYSFTPVASDVDVGQTLTFSVQNLPTWASFNATTGTVSGTPTNDHVGVTGSIVISVSDGTASATLPGFTITVVNTNDAPVISGTPSTSVQEDAAYSFTPVASDVDVGQSLTFSVQNLPSWASFNATTGTLSGTPTNDHVGVTGSIVISVSDGTASTALPGFTINVVNTNDAPVISGTPLTSVQQDVAYSFTPTASDIDVGQPLTFAVQNLPAWASFNAATGTLSGTPRNDHVGVTGSIVISVSDGIASATLPGFTINVINVNDAPTIGGIPPASVQEGAAYSFAPVANDVDVGQTLSFSVQNRPAWASFDATTGALSGTPTNDHVGVTETIVISVSDGTASASLPGFTIDVVNINDDPVISGTPPTTVEEGTAYSFTPVASDVDAGQTLTFSVQNLPSWASFDATTGTLSGTPTNEDVGVTGAIVISVSDGTASAALSGFSITVIDGNDAPVISGAPQPSVEAGQPYRFIPQVTDEDAEDTLTFSVTGLPLWAQLNTETGEISGVPDEPQVSSDIVLSVSDGSVSVSLPAFTIEVLAAVDSDGDNVSDTQEALDGTDPLDPSDYRDVLAPELTAPALVVLDASALFTPVSLRQLLGLNADSSDGDLSDALNALASDNVDGAGCCNAQPVDLVEGSVFLPPGRNEVTWQATDRKGNVGTATQIVKIRPLVSLSNDQVTVEGATATVKVLLNGRAPDYPFVVPFVIDGASTASEDDYTLSEREVTFTAGQTQALIAIPIVLDSIPDSEETLVLRLDDRTNDLQDLMNGFDPENPDIFDINAGAKTRHTLRIVEGNVAPSVRIDLQQGGVATTLVTPGGGPVTATALVTDPNPNENFTFVWGTLGRALVDADGDAANGAFVFDPASLNPGGFTLEVTVTDSGNESDTRKLHFRIVPALPVLSDSQDTDNDGVDDLSEGFGDSDNDGIPDYLDSSFIPSNVVPANAAQNSSRQVECDPGVSCRLGQFAGLSSGGGVAIAQQEFEAQTAIGEDPDFDLVSDLFDYEIHDLVAGSSTRIVLPLNTAIPADATYRKFQNGQWMSFAENASNAIHSAQGSIGFCPPPGDADWEPGLVQGAFCVQLTIEDGGPNDADGSANGVVEDPGVVSVRKEGSSEGGNAPKPKKRGGSIASDLLLIMLALLALGSALGWRRKTI